MNGCSSNALGCPLAGEKTGPGPRRGFTLVELLVVLTVITVLAAALFPAVQGALDRGRAASCLSNMRQIGIGFNLFAADQNGTFPVWYYNGPSPVATNLNVWWYWCDLIQPYVDAATPRPKSGGAGDSVGVQEGSGNKFRSTVFDCLSHKNAAHMEYKYNRIMGRYQGGTFTDGVFMPVESTISGMTSVFGVRLDSVIGVRSPPPPSRFVVVIDAIHREYPALDNFTASGQFMTRYDSLHQKGRQFNAAYADGHAAGLDHTNITAYSGSSLPFNLPP